MKWFLLLVVVACHDAPASTVTIPAASTSASVTPVPVAPASTTPPPQEQETQVTLGAATHFKNNAHGRAGDVTFTVRMLPKLMVSGPVPEIEQAQLDVARGADHTSLHVDTRHKSAEWSGLVFELGYADVYHDDIELTIRKK